MSLVVVGLNHSTAPVELLERVAVPRAGLPKALHALAGSETMAEVVVLSTCNRTEIYAHCTLFHPTVQTAHDFLADLSGLPPDDLASRCYTYYDDAAVSHLFGVAAGIDSVIVGEGEILGQVREAWQVAAGEGHAGPLLARSFQHAVEVGKRARTETSIGRHAASVSSAAVALAAERLGTLANRRVLVLGAGEVSEGMAVALAGAGVAGVTVANRTRAQAASLARRVDGEAIALDELADALCDTDVLLTSTSSDGVLLERADVEDVMARRGDRALLIVDVAVPRDVDSGVGQVFGVDLLDMDDLKAFAEQSLELRRQEIGRVRDIIARELDRYRVDSLAREVAPLVAQLHRRGNEIRQAELERFRTRLDALDPSAREAVEVLTQGIVNKLLHEPTVRVKDAAGTARGELIADALVTLFDLEVEGDA